MQNGQSVFFSVSPRSRSLFSSSFHTFCLTARAYLNTQKYGLFCSLLKNCIETPLYQHCMMSFALMYSPQVNEIHPHDASPSTFLTCQEINMSKRSAIALRLPSWSKLAILPWVSDFLTFLTTVQCRQQETSQRFCETLVGHMFFKCDEMS